MNNKKVKLLSTCLAFVGSVFGSIYSITLSDNNLKTQANTNLVHQNNNDVIIRGKIDFN